MVENRPNIAVIDDDKQMRDLIIQILNLRKNCNVFSFENGSLAWEYLKNDVDLDVILSDTDITPFTAPNMDIVGDMMENLGKPLWELFLYSIDSNYPRASRLARWRYKKKIAKIERKYFSGSRNAKNFAADKSYRLVLCEPGNKV